MGASFPAELAELAPLDCATDYTGDDPPTQTRSAIAAIRGIARKVGQGPMAGTIVTTVRPVRALRERQHLSQKMLAKEVRVSRRTVMRAEQGYPLNPSSVRLLCDYFGRSAAELGLVTRRGSQADSRYAHLPPVGNGDDMRRRELLGLLNVAGAALVWPSDLEVDWGRLDQVVAAPSLVDDAVLQDCATLNLAAWQAYRSASRKGVVLDTALEQLHRLTRLLHHPRTSAQQRRLCILIADLGQLIGEIFFDTNQYGDAVNCYTFAAGLARDAGAYDLWAASLVRQSFISIYDHQYHRALPLLDAAARLAGRGDSTLATRQWVAAVAAGAHAGVGDLSACQRALAKAEEVRALRDGTNGTWLRFDGARLPEERGACYVRLRRPDLAEPALQVALHQLPTPTRRRGLVLTDLALATVQARDVDRACTYGREILAIAQLGSGVLLKGLHTLDAELDAFTDVPAVQDLRREIRRVA